MPSSTRFWVLGVLFGVLASAQTLRVIPTELTVPLGTTGTFQILINPSTPANCTTRGSKRRSTTGGGLGSISPYPSRRSHKFLTTLPPPQPLIRPNTHHPLPSTRTGRTLANGL